MGQYFPYSLGLPNNGKGDCICHKKKMEVGVPISVTKPLKSQTTTKKWQNAEVRSFSFSMSVSKRRKSVVIDDGRSSDTVTVVRKRSEGSEGIRKNTYNRFFSEKQTNRGSTRHKRLTRWGFEIVKQLYKMAWRIDDMVEKDDICRKRTWDGLTGWDGKKFWSPIIKRNT